MYNDNGCHTNTLAITTNLTLMCIIAITLCICEMINGVLNCPLVNYDLACVYSRKRHINFIVLIIILKCVVLMSMVVQ